MPSEAQEDNRVPHSIRDGYGRDYNGLHTLISIHPIFHNKDVLTGYIISSAHF